MGLDPHAGVGRPCVFTVRIRLNKSLGDELAGAFRALTSPAKKRSPNGVLSKPATPGLVSN